MKGILTLCGVTFLAIVAYAYFTLRQPENYGEPTLGVQSVKLSDLVSDPKRYLGKTVRVEGTITEQCKATGCYFYFATGGKKIKVELERILTTLGKREGRRAVVEGEVTPYEDTYQVLASSVEIK